MPKGILGCNVGSGNRDSAIRSSIVELIAASPEKQHTGIIYMFVDHMIRGAGAAGILCSGPVYSPPRTPAGCATHHDRCHTSGISLLSTGVLTISPSLWHAGPAGSNGREKEYKKRAAWSIKTHASKKPRNEGKKGAQGKVSSVKCSKT